MTAQMYGAPAGSRRGARRKSAACLITAALAAALISACGTVKAGSPGVGQDPAQDPAQVAAGAVAVRYANDVMTGHWTQAESLVLPANRQTVQVLQAVAPTGHGSARNLAVGSATENGNAMTVVLTGTVCPPAGGGAGCLTNTDPASSSPEFTVKLLQQGGTWYVYFPKPSASPGGTAPSTMPSFKSTS